MSKATEWVVRFDEGCWLAPWSGDPGRTLVRTSAKRYKSAECGRRALGQARRHRRLHNAVVVPYV